MSEKNFVEEAALTFIKAGAPVVVLGAIGFLFGGPPGAVAGAKIGAVVGGAAAGSSDNNNIDWNQFNS